MFIKIRCIYSIRRVSYMNETFKINIDFDEKGEELEKIVSYYLINQLKEKSTIGKNDILKS